MERQETTRQRAPLPAAKQVKVKQSTIPQNELRHRAYEIYLNRVANPGNEIGDWLQSEKELKAN